MLNHQQQRGRLNVSDGLFGARITGLGSAPHFALDGADIGLAVAHGLLEAADFGLVALAFGHVELRLLAHLSGDEHLVAAFCSGADFDATFGQLGTDLVRIGGGKVDLGDRRHQALVGIDFEQAGRQPVVEVGCAMHIDDAARVGDGVDQRVVQARVKARTTKKFVTKVTALAVRRSSLIA